MHNNIERLHHLLFCTQTDFSRMFIYSTPLIKKKKKKKKLLKRRWIYRPLSKLYRSRDNVQLNSRHLSRPTRSYCPLDFNPCFLCLAIVAVKLIYLFNKVD